MDFFILLMRLSDIVFSGNHFSELDTFRDATGFADGIHVNNIFKEGELDSHSVVKESLTTESDGKKYKTRVS